jgi:hypothetical protein
MAPTVSGECVVVGEERGGVDDGGTPDGGEGF